MLNSACDLNKHTTRAVTTRRGRMPVASTLRRGAVLLRTGGVYCAHIYSEVSLGWAAAVQELWRRRSYSGPGRAGSWSRAWTGVQWAWQGAESRAWTGVQWARQGRQLEQSVDGCTVGLAGSREQRAERGRVYSGPGRAGSWSRAWTCVQWAWQQEQRAERGQVYSGPESREQSVDRCTVGLAGSREQRAERGQVYSGPDSWSRAWTGAWVGHVYSGPGREQGAESRAWTGVQWA